MNSMMSNKKWKLIATAGILTLSIIAAIFVRVKEASQLQDKYLSGYDSYFYYRQAKTIVADGHLPDRDYMQHYPDGVNLRGRANLNCYAIAYLYKSIRIFAPKISIERVAIYYPVVCFTLILIVFFGLTNHLFDRSISLIAVTILATIPAAVSRTFAGWADRDALSLLTWLVCIYFYVAAYRALSQDKRYLLLALLSGISMGALGLTWPGVGLLSIIIVGFNTVKLITQSYDQKKFYIYLCWYIPSVLMMLSFTERYSSNLYHSYALAAIALPTIFAIVAGLGILIRQINVQWLRRLLWGVLFASLAILLFVGLVPPQQIIDTFLHPAGTGIFKATVGEFQTPQLSDWLARYRLFFIFPLLGLLLVTYAVTKTYHMHAKAVTGLLAITVAATILSALPDTRQRLMEIVYFGSVILFIGAIGVSYFWDGFNKRGHISTRTDLLLLLLVWALLALFYSRGAIRFALFLVPPAVILGVYAIMLVLKRAASYDEKRISNLAMLMSFMVLIWQLRAPCREFLLNIGLDSTVSSLVCINLAVVGVIFGLLQGIREFSGEKKSPAAAKTTWLALSIAMCIIAGGFPRFTSNWISLNVMGDLPTPDEIKAFKWLKTNTPPKSVVAAWWDYGSRIGAIAERATIVDQQHNMQWIHLMAREVFCAEIPEEALKFLKSHKATHLMIQPVDAFIRLEDMSAVASTPDIDRNILIEPFRIHKQASNSSDLSQEKSVMQISPQAFEYSDSLEYTTERYLPCFQENPSAKHADIEYKSDGSFHKAVVRIDDMSISPAHVIFDDKKQEIFDGSGGLVVTNVDVHYPYQILESKHAVYFDEKACSQLAFKLYFLGSQTDHFKQVYPTQETGGNDSSPFNDIKIWQINY